MAGPRSPTAEQSRGRTTRTTCSRARASCLRAWSLASGDGGEPVTTSGTGATPFRTSWTRLAPPGSAYELVFRLEVDTRETGHRLVDARVAVSVRSPALQD